MNCPHCQSTEVIRHKTTKYATERIYCKACSSWSTNKDVPKVLLFDIETSRVKIETDVWADQVRKPTYLGHKSVKEDWYMLSWAGSWLFSGEAFGDVLRSSEAKERNDKRIAKSLHKTIQSADVVITHNGNRFDIKKINWRFLVHGLEPAMRYKSIDTLAKSKQVFGVTSLAMDFMCRQLGYEQKHHTDYGLWEACEEGDKPALTRMYEYNKNDVFMLEDLYLRTRGWYLTHPSFSYLMDMYQPLQPDEHRCPRCTHVVNDSKFAKKWTTPAGYVYKTCNCPECGAMLRKTHREGGQMVSVR